jgi:putative sigma-54 modulation protein
MNVNVQSIHFDADSKLVDFIQDKLDKLSQFHDNIISGDVFLRLSHDREGRENKLVEIRLNAPGQDLFSSRRAKTFEEAVVNTVDALRSQVERSKPSMRKTA